MDIVKRYAEMTQGAKTVVLKVMTAKTATTRQNAITALTLIQPELGTASNISMRQKFSLYSQDREFLRHKLKYASIVTTLTSRL